MSVAVTPPRGPERTRTARQAARAAWGWWMGMMALPVLTLSIGMLIVGPAEAMRWNEASILFFIVSVIWMVLTAPAALVLRSHCFRAAWQGRPVSPPRYVRGVVTVWAALEIGVLLAVLGALAGAAWMPCLLPAAIGMMLLAMLWPARRAIAA